MNNDYWLKRWTENRIGFHKHGVNPLLERLLPRAETPGRVLVPLCGKSADLVWLASRGYSVTAVDLSEIAARSFFAENNLDAGVAEEPPFRVFSSKGIRFYVGDFFDLTAARIGQFDLVYDRAALIALPRNVRGDYATRLESLVAPGGRIFLISLQYSENEMSGPPFTVTESEARSLFEGWKIEKLYEHDCIDEEPHFRERGLTSMIEVVLLLDAARAIDKTQRQSSSGGDR